MKEAYFYRTVSPQSTTIKCYLCNHGCVIRDNLSGICKVRFNKGGRLYSSVYGNLISSNIEPIEKKPVFHLLPGSLSYSIATVGCNFRCRHCQNYDISQFPLLHPDTPTPGKKTSPEQVVTSARSANCQSISFTYIEPTIFFEFAYDTAIIAHQQHIKTVFVSNGYTSREATKKIAPYLDANNIDLKAFSDKFYREVCGAKLAPVLDTIQLMKELGVWVEVTTLIIPGWNDSDRELRDIACFIAGVDRNIPWHVSRFHPTYKMTDHPSTPPSTLHRARQIGLAEGLRYVYTGNIPGQGHENTYCPDCHKSLITREGYTVLDQQIKNGGCPSCGTLIAGIWVS